MSERIIDIPISKIVVLSNNPRQYFDEKSIRQLGENIKEYGQIQNIVVRPRGDDYELVVGERRVRACALVGIPTIRAEIRNLDDISSYELKLIENVHREDLSDSEKGDAIYQLWAFDKYETIKEVCESLQISYDTVKDNWLRKARRLSQKVKDLIGGGVRENAFTDTHARSLLKYSHAVQNKLAKVSIDRKLTSRQLQELTKLYDEDPKADLNQLADKVLGIKKVEIPVELLTEEQKKALEEAKAKKQRKPRTKPSKPKKKEEIKKKRKSTKPFRFKKINIKSEKEKPVLENAPPIPKGKYRCIIIDPPWEMEKIERDERPNQGKYLDYPTMSLEQIKNLPIKDRAFAEGCHIYLWTTHKHLPEAFSLFDSWGVKYQCLMTWVKPTGMTPYSWMYNTEHVLFGRIGSLQLLKLGIKLSFEERGREHSRKPDIFYDIVRQASPEPRLDMFSRETRDGYVPFGNEVNKFDS